MRVRHRDGDTDRVSESAGIRAAGRAGPVEYARELPVTVYDRARYTRLFEGGGTA